MPATAPTILATSTGSASRGRRPADRAPGPVFDLAFRLAGAPARARLCYLGTTTGDDPARVAGVYGAFAGSAVHRGTDLVEAVADRGGAAAYRVAPGPDGTAVETRLAPRRLA